MTEFGGKICVYGEIITRNTKNKQDKGKLRKTGIQ
jgi:hypothetical protein